MIFVVGDNFLCYSGPRPAKTNRIPTEHLPLTRSAYGEERRLLGPLAVIPGDRTAPLWLTVKGAGALVVIFPMLIGLFLFTLAQIVVGIKYKDEKSCRPWPGESADRIHNSN